ncbi:MAG: outer membrane beta-barrel protein [Chryseolinea sp.]
MKNIFSWTIGALMLSFVPAYSQHDKVELGLRFIPQATTFRYTQGVAPIIDFLKISAPYYFRVRTAQGIGILYNPVQRLRLGADLLYSMQGGGYEERKTNLNYLKIPMWIGFNAKSKHRIIFTVQSGIEFGFLISAKIKYSQGESVDIRHYVNKTSWGIPFAMGVKFKVHQTYYVTTQLYLYSDFNTIAKTNSALGAYNYVYPGLRICIDQNLSAFKIKK